MINLTTLTRSAVVGSLMLAGMSVSTPVIASDADLALIQSYVGEWRGRGSMTNDGQAGETVVCRLAITHSTAEKINFNGRCTLAGANLSMSGTMAYISAANRFEAVMTSNTAFTGNAIGHRRGSSVTFNLQSTDESGGTSNVRASFGLVNGDIKVGFRVTNADGTKIVADIPFERQ